MCGNTKVQVSQEWLVHVLQQQNTDYQRDTSRPSPWQRTTRPRSFLPRSTAHPRGASETVDSGTAVDAFEETDRNTCTIDYQTARQLTHTLQSNIV